MSSAFSLFAGIWPLKKWISRWRQYVEEGRIKQATTELSDWEQVEGNDGVSEPRTYCDAHSTVSSATNQTAQDTWVDVQPPATSLGDRSYATPMSRSDSTSSGYRERARKDKIPAGQRSNTLVDRPRSGQVEESVSRREIRDAQWSDLIPTLERMRDANEQVNQLIFEWNSTRAPLFKQMETIIQSLDWFMQQITPFANIAGFREHVSSRLGELHSDLEIFRANQVQYTETEDEIIQSLYRSGRDLDRLLGADSALSSVGTPPDTLTSVDNIETEDNVLERTPEMERYLSQLDVVDGLRERLNDERLERAQLLREQESRAQFGLSLDDESLQFLDTSREQEQVLLDELEYALLALNALERLVHDQEVLRIPGDVPYNEEDEKAGLVEAIGPVAVSESPIAHSTSKQSPLPFHQVLQTGGIRFADHLAGPSTAPIQPANFINIWLLHRVCSLPRLLLQFTSLLETHQVTRDAQSMENLFVTTWFEDGSAADFARHRTFADQQSKLVYIDDSHFLRQRSDAVYTHKPASIPLLKIGPSTTAQDIVTQAIRTRSSTLS